MRKGTPNVPLSVVKEMVRSGKVKTTFTATQGALELGFPAPVLPLKLFCCWTRVIFIKV